MNRRIPRRPQIQAVFRLRRLRHKPMPTGPSLIWRQFLTSRRVRPRQTPNAQLQTLSRPTQHAPVIVQRRCVVEPNLPQRRRRRQAPIPLQKLRATQLLLLQRRIAQRRLRLRTTPQRQAKQRRHRRRRLPLLQLRLRPRPVPNRLQPLLLARYPAPSPWR